MVSNGVIWNVRQHNKFHSAVQGFTLLFLITLSLSFAAKPALAAAGGSCPTGNTTIDPEGNPINVANVGVNGNITGGITSCFYISKANGNDTNSGTSEASPWAHLPGMPSCTANCASANPSAGEGFILRGGDTWTSGDLGINWSWSGNSSHPIYVGVDPGWYNSSCGGSWCRPILNDGAAVGSNQFNMANESWVIIDNLESAGMRNNQNGCQMSGGSNERCTQLYFHGWSHTGSSNNVGFFAQCGSGSMIDHNVIDGSDSSQNTFNGVYSSCAGTIQYNYFGHVVSGVLATVDNFNNNLIEDAVTSIDGDHCNLMFIFGPASGSTLNVYNNIVRKMICSGGVNFWLNGNSNGTSSWVTNAYNNIIDASPASGNVFNIGGHPSAGNTGTYNIYNTTVIAENGGTCMGNGEASPRSTTNFSNLHCIGGSELCDGTGTTCNNQGGNLLQPASTASSQGYTASEVFQYSPAASCTPGTCSTVQAGIDQSAHCSGTMTALCNSITYPMYDSTNHTMSMNTSAPAGNSRGSTWDIGAYEFGGAGSAPNPPTGLSAVVN
jgi:hypothetical protein